MKYFLVSLAIVLAAACSGSTEPRTSCPTTVEAMDYGTGAGWGGWDVHRCNKKHERVDCLVFNQAHQTYTADEAIDQCEREDE